MSKIPAGATHEGKGECRFYVKDLIPGVSFSFCNEKSDGTFTNWRKSDNATPLYAITPIPRDWNGPEDGLPPVGLEVEIRLLTEPNWSNWCRAKVLFCKDNALVFEWVAEGVAHPASLKQCQVRQIRTAEQLAAEERDKEIAAIQKASGGDGLPPITFTHAAKLHNAGLRLPVKP